MFLKVKWMINYWYAEDMAAIACTLPLLVTY